MSVHETSQGHDRPKPRKVHSHGHPRGVHSHGGGGSASSMKALTWALVLNGLFLIVEAAIGFATGSLALLSDAAHMVGDVGALTVALGAAWLSRRPPTAEATFGLVRVEVLGGFINALLLILGCGWLFYEAIQRLFEGSPDVHGMPVLVAGVLGLAINLGSAYFLMKGDTDNLNIKGAVAHMLADALGSVGAIVAAIGLIYGINILDPLVSILISAIVAVGTIRLLIETSRVLLQFTPNGVLNDEVKTVIERLEGVGEVHDLHVWSIDGQQNLMSAHVVAEPGKNLPDIRKRVKNAVQSTFGIQHTTIQMELGDDVFCTQTPCPFQGGSAGRTGVSKHAH